ncbi:uncharacterized protein Z519_09856 [Cladophialophora bantiana CBS 173.52]|uniref:Methyltransferase domain-containing protein n=1 Tax=Cladophialophora bantiana (strain ATCC 10958 / CBS 173.52 / CDC B-1940 / NIH 8579) TaxID=1442370 RepID=A0A0D2HFY1_CLAB1|nr:uncharacterized protein Z519_09856 [Cladophialophora bantiana CBS 173.52]KIW89700.1 hypothetical protein Z519_09856 [Cladophialophora bantiana CBS 173.52]
MPRLPPALIRQATSQNPLLTLLLRVCRDLPSARNELRWLQEHARDVVNTKRYASHEASSSVLPASTAQGESVPIRKHEAKKLTVRKVKVLTERTRIRTYNVGKISSLRAEGPRPSIRKVPTQNKHDSVRAFKPAKIRTWHDDGVRELRLRSQSDEVLVTGESNEHVQVQKILAENVGKRSKGMPLQYIIGNQPFGNLDILCQRRVLIPRPETEMYTEKVGNLLLSALNSIYSSTGPRSQTHKKFRILDLCTGTGCIALLLHSVLKPPGRVYDNTVIPPNISIEILGVDNSPDAVSLARTNLKHNISQKLLHPDAANEVSFRNVDVLALAKKGGDGDDRRHHVRKVLNAAAADVGEDDDSYSPSESWDMIIANPPYIGPKDYERGGKTEPSVRDYEPKEALVPRYARGQDSYFRYRSSSILVADLFYWPLMRIARAVDAKLLVMEVGDSEQASRVCKQVFNNYSPDTAALSQFRPRLETWRDDGSVRIIPTQPSANFDAGFEEATDPDIADRAVVVWTDQMADWRRETLPASNPEFDETLRSD